MPFPIPRPPSRQRGGGTAAFAIAAVPLLFCALLAIEGARWHITRQALHLALLEAARAGATAHGRPAAIEQAFETALLPLFHPPGPHKSPRARMRASFLAVTQQTGAPPWRIDVLSPTAGAYADFGDTTLRVAGARGLPAISNDYQAEQHLRRRRMGWPGGRGPRSGQTIFEANTLRLRLAYAHPPMVPGVRTLLRRLASVAGGRDPAARAGMLRIAMELDLPMQSHPVQWSAAADGRLSRHRTRGIDSGKVDGRSGAHPARDRSTPAMAMGAGAAARLGLMGDARTGVESGVVTGDAAEGGASSATEEALCGVLLCCVTAPSS
ncbi:hypothetical protein [Bordetella sp. H567]|uniref:hypothetical protein n=1 Tax=Bordetella sp. H567 TaxID=1697043 RepID=UPI0008312B7A|nr:hypothetical protein [Bordetella sp. H567]